MSGWKKSSLGELANAKGCVIQTGPFGSQLHKGEYQQEGVGVINPTHIKNRGVSHDSVPHVSGEVAERLAKHKVRAGDLLFARRGEIGRHALAKDSEHGWLCGTGCFLVRLNQEVADPSFVSYFLSTDDSLEWLNRHASGVVMPNLSNQVLQKAPVQVPCLAEQKEISRILSTVERAIELQERVIQTTTELKQALMQKLFSEGLRGEPQKETEIGLVPESWEVVEIGDIFKFTSGKTKPKDTAPKASDDRTVPVFGGNGILGYSSERLLDKETLILGRVGEYCGCAHLAPHASWVTDNALYASEERRAVNRAYIRTHFEHLNLNQHKNKMGQPLITQGIINTVKFGLPQAEEQDELAHTFETLDSRITQAQAKRDLLKELFRALLHELMTAQTRVI